MTPCHGHTYCQSTPLASSFRPTTCQILMSKGSTETQLCCVHWQFHAQDYGFFGALFCSIKAARSFLKGPEKSVSTGIEGLFPMSKDEWNMLDDLFAQGVLSLDLPLVSCCPPQKLTSAACRMRCRGCPSHSTERTYSCLPWLSRTKKSPLVCRSFCTSTRGMAPWYQVCCPRGFCTSGSCGKEGGSCGRDRSSRHFLRSSSCMGRIASSTRRWWTDPLPINKKNLEEAGGSLLYFCI